MMLSADRLDERTVDDYGGRRANVWILVEYIVNNYVNGGTKVVDDDKIKAKLGEGIQEIVSRVE